MYREIIYFCAELLNYWSMTFFGLKLFAKVYEFSVHRNKNVENVIYALLCLPMGILGAVNYYYVIYSMSLTYIIILYMYIVIIILSRINKNPSFSLIAFFVFGIRIIDLWCITVIEEANHLSRHIYMDLIHRGNDRVIFIAILTITYYLIYSFSCKNTIFKYLVENKIYCRILCFYSFLGNSCFSTVYQFDYKDKLIGYWTFYLICAFILIGGFLFYFIGIKGKERERLLNLRNDMMEANYLGLQKVYEEHRTLQHDHKNHMLAVSELIKESKNNEAIDYIQDYLTIRNKLSYDIKSGNDIINIIVSSKIAETKEKGIKFDYEVEYLNQLEMDDIDICALLANLLDNAVEACEKVINQEQKILLKILKKNDMLIIQIMNSICSDLVKKKQLFKTDKDNPQLHGWGMNSIEQVVKKYGGEKSHFIKDEMIEIFITIPL